jgi:hypothetical protein
MHAPSVQRDDALAVRHHGTARLGGMRREVRLRGPDELIGEHPTGALCRGVCVALRGIALVFLTAAAPHLPTEVRVKQSESHTSQTGKAGRRP